MLVGFTVTVTPVIVAGAAPTVTAALPEIDGSSTEVAVIVAVPVPDAVNSPELEIVPYSVPPPVVPLTCQVTAVSMLSPTEAVKATGAPPAWALGPFGATATTVRGMRQALLPALAGASVLALVGVMITVALLLCPPLSVRVSVTVTVPLLGALTFVVAPLALETGALLALLDH